MHQVFVPDQNRSPLWPVNDFFKLASLGPLAPHRNHLFPKLRPVAGADFLASGSAQVEARKPMAALVDLQLAGVRFDVFERHPHAAHISRGERRQMNRVLMHVLLASEYVGQRLTGTWRRFENEFKKAQNSGMQP